MSKNKCVAQCLTHSRYSLYVAPAISNETHHHHNINPFRIQCLPRRDLMLHWLEGLNGFSSHYQGGNLSTGRKTQWYSTNTRKDTPLENSITSTSQMFIKCLLFTRYCVGSGDLKICNTGILFPWGLQCGETHKHINPLEKFQRKGGISLNWGGQERFGRMGDVELQPGVSCWCTKFFCHPSLSTASSPAP